MTTLNTTVFPKVLLQVKQKCYDYKFDFGEETMNGTQTPVWFLEFKIRKRLLLKMLNI
jgi:hypothetical protein